VLLGHDHGVAQLVAALPELCRADPAGAGEEVFGVSVPRHLEPLLHQDFRVHGGGDWEWFHTSVAPAAQPEDDVVGPVDDEVREEEVAAFLARHSPTADTAPGRGERWFAIESASGRLAAVTAYGTTATSAPHLSSVTVDTTLRGRGLGRRIVSVVTRVAVTERGVCTLGMYSDNTVARALYLALGYDNPNAWASRAVTLEV
jgi:GNAT superfamily N-acetyltransferase